MKKIRLSLAAMLAAAIFLTISPAWAEERASAEAQDAVAMYLIKHAAEIDLRSGTITLDGQFFGKERIPIRNNRSFVPIRLLRELGIGTVEWNAKAREVKVTADPQLRPPLQTVVFRVGSKRLYTEEGTAFPDIVMEAPFLEQGRVYVPLQYLYLLGVSVEYSKPYIRLSWSQKKFEIHTPVMKAEDGEARFTVLYESETEAPLVLTHLGGGGWSGPAGTRKIVGREIAKDGRTFTRMEFAVPLQPGTNPLMLNSFTFGSIILEASWQPKAEEEVPFLVSRDWPVVFDQPRYGYVIAEEGEPVAVSGTVTLESERMDEITLQLEQYDPAKQTFVRVGEEIRIPIVESRFDGIFTAPKPGTYLVNVYSPEYIPAMGGPVSTKWADFVLDVRQ